MDVIQSKESYYFIVEDWTQDKIYKVLINPEEYNNPSDIANYTLKIAKNMSIKQPSFCYTESYELKLSKDEKDIIGRSPILLLHGTQDSVVPFSCFLDTLEHFEYLKIPYEAHPIDGLGHVINGTEIDFARSFLINKLNLKL